MCRGVRLVAVLFALACIVIGVASYTGRFRWWATEFAYGWYAGFSLFYVGVIFLIPAGFSVFGPPPEPFMGILFSIFVICSFPVMFSFYLMPSFLLPQWFIEGREGYRQWEQLGVALRKAARRRKAQLKRIRKRDRND